jgi:diguanylate cyclase (GGDEF)-like protein
LARRSAHPATAPLTGIANRLRFAQAVEEEAQRKRRNGTPMALVVFDIDRFKQVNDRFGHNAGDAVLKRLVEVIRAEVRATNFFARWGGEEFILLLRDDNCDAAYATAESLVSRADKALYASKHHGRDQVSCGYSIGKGCRGLAACP